MNWLRQPASYSTHFRIKVSNKRCADTFHYNKRFQVKKPFVMVWICLTRLEGIGTTQTVHCMRKVRYIVDRYSKYYLYLTLNSCFLASVAHTWVLMYVWRCGSSRAVSYKDCDSFRKQKHWTAELSHGISQVPPQAMAYLFRSKYPTNGVFNQCFCFQN